MSIFFPILLILTVNTSFSKEIKDLAYDSEWIKLLYYKKSGDKYIGLSSNKNFYIAPTGSTDPYLELKESLKQANLTAPYNDTHFQCLFPARTKFLKKYFDITAVPICNNLASWKKSYLVDNISLIFASQYVSNPSSAFGHTFLLLKSDKIKEYLQLTFNYSAEVPKDINAAMYVLKGLTGGFEGSYTSLFFIERLYQYGDVENRNLWEYELNFTKQEVNLFIDHLWELQKFFNSPYLFLTDNCSGVILRTIEAIRPSLQLRNHYKIAIPPAESIKVLEKNNMVKSFKLHLSKQAELKERIALLSSDSVRVVKTAIKEKELAQITRLDEIDTLIDYMSFKNHDYKGQLPNELENFQKKILVKRSKMKGSTQKIKPAYKKAPHHSHDYKKINFAQRWINGSSHQSASFRLFIHEIMDPSTGFLPNSSVEIPKLELLYNKDQDLYLSKLSFINFENIRPYTFYDPALSWGAHASWKRLLTNLNQDHYYLDLYLYGGISRSFFNDSFSLFATIPLNFRAGNFGTYGQMASGLSLGSIFQLAKFKLLTTINYHYQLSDFNVRDFYSLNTRLRYALSQNHGLHFDYLKEDEDSGDFKFEDYSLSYSYFF